MKKNNKQRRKKMWRYEHGEIEKDGRIRFNDDFFDDLKDAFKEGFDDLKDALKEGGVDETEGKKFSIRTGYTNEELMESYQNLPKDIQDAILSVDTADIIREIGENHKLMIDKIGELADETGLVMLGFTRIDEYVPRLIERLKVGEKIAKEIAEEINGRIFYPIRDSLQKIQNGLLKGDSRASIRSPSTKSSYPNVIRSADGKLQPASGYQWVNADDPKDFRVELKLEAKEEKQRNAIVKINETMSSYKTALEHLKSRKEFLTSQIGELEKAKVQYVQQYDQQKISLEKEITDLKDYVSHLGELIEEAEENSTFIIMINDFIEAWNGYFGSKLLLSIERMEWILCKKYDPAEEMDIGSFIEDLNGYYYWAKKKGVTQAKKLKEKDFKKYVKMFASPRVYGMEMFRDSIKDSRINVLIEIRAESVRERRNLESPLKNLQNSIKDCDERLAKIPAEIVEIDRRIPVLNDNIYNLQSKKTILQL